MKIVSLQAENIKRLVAAEIRPDGNLVEITGENGQGKTSLLDAIWWALDTNKVVQSKPVRDGADRGFVRLDLGEYIVTKTFKTKEGGETGITLTVQNQDGAKYGSPQELLKGFYGTFTFDPLAFAEMKPRDQVVALRALVPGYDFAAADKANKEDFDRRTEVNRSARDLRARVDAIVVPEDTPDEPISLSDLMNDLNEVMSFNASIDRANAERRRWQDVVESLDLASANRDAQIRDFQRRFDDLKADGIAAAKERDEATTLIAKIEVGEAQDTAPIRQRIADSEGINRNVGLRKQREELLSEHDNKLTESDALTRAIADRKDAAAKAVREAKLPIPGLELADEHALLNGVPLDQASDAEQLRLSIAVAAAMSPKLRIARVRDGSKLDRHAMVALADFAAEHDIQVWIETVESGRESAIVIEDGRVAGASIAEAAE